MATVDFLRKLVDRTGAATDQDQIPVLAYFAATIPDRTQFLVGAGPDPYPYLLQAMLRLRDCGVAAVAMPCNTAHFWADALERDSGVALVHMVAAVVEHCSRSASRAAAVGLMATRGTIHTNIYPTRLSPLGIRCVSPDDVEQDAIDAAIRLVKSGRPCEAKGYAQIAEASLVKRGAEAIVLACTELPVALSSAPPSPVPRIDATDVLAGACVRWFASRGARAD